MANGTTSQFELYLLPVLVNVLEYLDVACRFRVAAANRRLREAVFGEAGNCEGNDDSVRTIWENLCFAGVTTLTDEQLRTILLWVRAKDVTKQICLDGCHSLTGRSLAALKGSKVLERVVFYSDRCSVSKNFLLRTFRPSMRHSLYYINFFGSSIQSCRTTSACSKCGIWKYEYCFTPCHMCQLEVCSFCSPPDERNKCVRCNAIIWCSSDCECSSSGGESLSAALGKKRDSLLALFRKYEI